MNEVKSAPVRPEKRQRSASRLSGWALFAAVVAILAYGAMIVFLVTAADSQEVVWSRLIYVFSSVQALAFAAAGTLWGTTISQARVEKAEAQASESAVDATNGKALAAALKAESTNPKESDGDRNFRGQAPADNGAQVVIVRHAELADRLFPRV